jgi:PqqD family protein of HPr-rel-A system
MRKATGIDRDVRMRLSDDVMARRLGDETVLLDIASGTYFGLDGAGTRIWQLLEEGRSMSEIERAMLVEFDVEADVARRDLAALFEELAERRLIEPAPRLS